MYCIAYIFISSFLVFEKITASLRRSGWVDSSRRWWWFRICNKNHSLSFTFSIFFTIKIHHFHHFVILSFCHLNHVGGLGHSCKIDQSHLGLCTAVVAVHLRYQAVASRDQISSVDHCYQAWTTDVLNPTLCPTPCQLFVGCWLFMRTCTHIKTAGRWPQIMISLPFKGHTHYG